MPVRNWTRDALISLEAAPDAFYLAQMLPSPVLAVFAPPRATDAWHGTALRPEDVLFCAFVGKVVLSRLARRRVPPREARPLAGFVQRRWIRPRLNFTGAGGPFRGGTLIDIDVEAGQGSLDATVVEKGLTAGHPAIATHDLTLMWGAEDLGARLRRHARTGDATDTTKAEIFPPPPT